MRKTVLNSDVYQKELSICKNLSAENGGKCNWGTCKDCGVIPLLIKLHEGRLLEDTDEIKKAKGRILE